MYKSKTGPLNKINQILLYSNNYSVHKKNLNQIKPCVDNSSSRRNEYHKKLLNQHMNNLNAAKNLKDRDLSQQNQKIFNRIIYISKQQLSLQKQKSICNKTFINLKIANQRKRLKQNRQISLENEKITERLKNSRSKQDYGRSSYYKQKKQIQKDLDVLGNYSKRSQSVLQNLVYKSLKINVKNIPFLPQLIGRYKTNKDDSNPKQKNKFQLQKHQKTNNLSFSEEYSEIIRKKRKF